MDRYLHKLIAPVATKMKHQSKVVTPINQVVPFVWMSQLQTAVDVLIKTLMDSTSFGISNIFQGAHSGERCFLDGLGMVL